MSKLLLVAALAAAPHAFAQERHFEAFTAYELAHMDNAGPSSCADLIGPQRTPENTVSAASCAEAIQDYFSSRHEDTGVIQPNQTISSRMECAARLILAHSSEQTTVADILAAEFDKACNGQATM